MSFFKAFRSTITPFIARDWLPRLRLLVDPVTGAPVGVQNPNDSGADGIWTPIDVTAAQIGAPSAAMLADLNAVYRLNVQPYTRYRSNGVAVVALDGSNVQGPNGIFGTMVVYAPMTITDPAGIAIEGTVKVISLPV